MFLGHTNQVEKVTFNDNRDLISYFLCVCEGD